MWIKNLMPTSILEKSKAKLVEQNRIYMMKKDWWSDEVHSLPPLWKGKDARNSQRKLAWPVQSWRDLAKNVVCCGKRITAIKVYQWAIKEGLGDTVTAKHWPEKAPTKAGNLKFTCSPWKSQYLRSAMTIDSYVWIITIWLIQILSLFI